MMKEELLKKLNSENKEEVREAIEELANHEEPEVIKALVKTAIERKSKAILEAVKLTLMSFNKENKLICEEVIKFFDYPEPKLRQAAIDILSDKGNTCLEIIKEKLLKSPDYNMRKFGLDILANIKTKEALKEIINMLEDENPNVSMTALEYLRNFSDFKEEVMEGILKVLPKIKDLYGLTTLASTVIYGEIKDKRLIEPLKEKLKEFSEPMEKHWIYKMLIFLGDRSILEKALENAKKAGMEYDIKKDIEIFGV